MRIGIVSDMQGNHCGLDYALEAMGETLPTAAGSRTVHLIRRLMKQLSVTI